MTPVLVDTSVFVDFFRGKEVYAFKELLLNNQILLSQFVRLELFQGVRQKEVEHMEFVLGGLQTIAIQEKIFPEAEKILSKVKDHGWRIGIVDLLLAAEANLVEATVYSFDRIFQNLGNLKLVSLFGPH